MIKPVKRVVFLVLDGFPYHVISPELTPHLWKLGQDGGWAREGARCDVPAITYPSHATMITGRYLSGHKIYSGLSAHPQPGIVPGWAGQSQVVGPTLFDICKVAGVKSAAVFGDQYLHPVLKTAEADLQWPPEGIVPPGTELDPFGYPTNKATLPFMLPVFQDSSIGFIFAHLNESDTAGHMFGPESKEALDCYSTSDGDVGQLLAALQEDWDDTIIIITSDHAMVSLAHCTVINLLENNVLKELSDAIVQERGSALLLLNNGVSLSKVAEILETMAEVSGWYLAEDRFVVIGAAPNYVFSAKPLPEIGGFHGSPTTARNLLVVGGGHPLVATLARSLQERVPHLVDLAPTIASLLNLKFSGFDGQDLIPAEDIVPEQF